MVNVPPIPPLLLTEPPPIDFGEEDDDVDISPTTINGVNGMDVGDDYDDFLTVIDIPNEALPSPSSSLSELPVIGLFEGRTYIEENSPPPLKLKCEKAKELSNNDLTSPPLEVTEAFNYNIKVECKESIANKSSDVYEISGDNESNKIEISGTKEESVAAAHTTVVLIEDLEDDISDDELYSPKISKNFTENDSDIKDYFKIQEIAKTNGNSNEKTIEDIKVINTDEDERDVEKDAELFSENVFAISSSLDDNNIEQNRDEIEDFGDFDHFEDFQTTLEGSEVGTTQTGKIKDFVEENDVDDIKDDLIERATVENIDQLKVNFSEDEVENSDFGDFDSFSLQRNSQECEFNGFSSYNTTSSIDNNIDKQNSNSITHSAASDENEIDFSNFVHTEIYENKEEEEFCKDTHITATETASVRESGPTLNSRIEKSGDSDDDFGDFNTAQPSITPATTVIPAYLNSTNTSHCSTSAVEVSSGSIPFHKTLNERVLKILQFMFPEEVNAPSTADSYDQASFKVLNDTGIPFPSIDSAKALDYQWTNSQTRHIFIKSLGIDSRNILFGENWNPSLPRYAANLSFNPLKPMRSQISNIPECSTYGSELNSDTKSADSYSQSNQDNIGFIENSMEVKVNTSVEQTKEVLNPIVTDTPSIAKGRSKPLAIVDYNHTTPLQLREEKYSKTPPLSEMETIERISSPLPSALDTVESIIHNSESFDLPEISPPGSSLNNNETEVIVTSTFSGSFKETHIYTPSKIVDIETKNSNLTPIYPISSPSKVIPIDFDYEKAAMGVIIDETVVKKEYRDVVYEPGFSLDAALEKETVEIDQINASVTTTTTTTTTDPANPSEMQLNSKKFATAMVSYAEDDEEFSDFQSVPSAATDVAPNAIIKNSLPFHSDNTTMTQQFSNSQRSGEASNPSATAARHGMILSPAILLPQAIAMENQTPKIEWGDSTANINPEELARIDELFPEPKSLKSTTSSSSQKSTPTRETGSSPSTLSISATVAHKEQQAQHNDDEDDWSDFISVPISNIKTTTQHQILNSNNNNNLMKSPNISPLKQLPPTNNREYNSNNDDEWSDFVSSVPPAANNNMPSLHCSSYRSVPQFNSGAWQNANFYNNPLSLYHKGPINIGNCHQQAPKHHSQLNNNNNHNYNPTGAYNNFHIPMQPQQVQHPPQQQIHIMQNFSTAPERLNATAAGIRNNQFQVGSAKVAPSIALIPDLGFVAPAIPTHTSFINSLPRPSLNTKK
uniref:Clathrin_bdg domain-containing protein n=1 Tax=Glossina brevipalpis TaxID=37001 RepID=A0A1A9WGG0_9MUSC